MFKSYYKNKQLKNTAHEIYGSIVAQSRKPVFYATWNIPDTIEGRFEVLVMHMALFIHRMDQIGPDGASFGQLVAEAFIDDLDGSFREMGVGDLAVPKRMKAASEAYLGRLLTYNGALKNKNRAELVIGISRNMINDENRETAQVDALADYMLRSSDRLGTQELDQVLSGQLVFADT